MIQPVSGLPVRYRSAVQNAVADVAEEFSRSPASFLYESDLQSLVFAKLFAELDDCRVRQEAPADYWRSAADVSRLAINPAKTEYPDSTRFDIALLDPVPDPAANIWNQPVRLALELKFRQANGGGPTFEADRSKLREYRSRAAPRRKFTGISLVFCHRPEDEQLGPWRLRDDVLVDPGVFDVPDDGFVAWVVTSAWRGRG